MYSTFYIALDLDLKKINNTNISNVLNVLLLDDFNTLILLLINDDYIIIYMGFPDSKESACSVGFSGSIPESGKIPWSREWLPTPVFLPGEFHGQRSLVGYSLWGCKELDITE